MSEYASGCNWNSGNHLLRKLCVEELLANLQTTATFCKDVIIFQILRSGERKFRPKVEIMRKTVSEMKIIRVVGEYYAGSPTSPSFHWNFCCCPFGQLQTQGESSLPFHSPLVKPADTLQYYKAIRIKSSYFFLTANRNSWKGSNINQPGDSYVHFGSEASWAEMRWIWFQQNNQQEIKEPFIWPSQT